MGDGRDGGAGVSWRLVGLGTLGEGQVRFLSVTEQNSRIFSYKYHCRCADRPSSKVAQGIFQQVMRFLIGPLLRVYYPRLREEESEMVFLLYVGQLLKSGGKEANPVICRDDHTSIFISDQLCLIAPPRPLDYLSNVGQTANLRPLEESLEQAEASLHSHIESRELQQSKLKPKGWHSFF